MAKGLYQEGAFVCVTYNGTDLVPISHALYRERGYEPAIDRLPTKVKYEARHPVAS